MPDLLLYQTSDQDFADRAVGEMLKDGIPSYRTGTSYADVRGDNLGAGVCIYIRQKADYRRANDILIRLGAAVETPFRPPPRGLVLLLAAAVTALIILVAINLK